MVAGFLVHEETHAGYAEQDATRKSVPSIGTKRLRHGSLVLTCHRR